MINIFFAVILASFASSIMGSFIVAKKVSSISGSISHSILGGVGISLFLKYKFFVNIDPIFGAFVAAILASLFISWLHMKKQKEDASIAIIWIVGMGLGALFISFVPNVEEDFVHFLFGDLFSISSLHIFLILALDILILVFSIIFYTRFLLICFDEEMATLKNLKVNFIYFLLFSLISLSIVVLVQIVGVILSIALLALPASIAKIFTKNFILIIILSFVFSFLFLFSGSILSLTFKIPPGATSSLIAAFCYILILILQKKFLRT